MAANPTVQALKQRLSPKPESAQQAEAAEAEAEVCALSSDASYGISPRSEPLASSADAESRHQAIARSAYFLAEARGFEPGGELDDWLAAEEQIGR
jgi:hypothetical protein